MNHRHLASLLLGSASLLAQGEIKVPRPFPVLPATKVAPIGAPAPHAPLSGDRIVEPMRTPQFRAVDATARPPSLSRLQGVVFDDQAGTVWAVSNTWKASFDARGATFVPFLGATAPRDLPVHF